MKRLYEYGETFCISIARLTAFRWSAGHNSGEGEEQQDSQNGDLHDDCSVERTADGMLWQVTTTEVIPITGRGSSKGNIGLQHFFVFYFLRRLSGVLTE